jgi:phage shock protein A
MGIFSRFSKMVKSNVNAKIDKATDPAKEIDQLILEMEGELRKGREETQKMMASEKRCTARVAELEKQSQVWTERAEAAVRAGDDGLAKQALERRISVEEDLAGAREELKETQQYVADLHDSLKKNTERLREVKMKKGTIKAKVATHKGGDVRAEALDEFERVAGKVDDEESQVEADAELASEMSSQARDSEVERKFVEMEKKGGTGSAIDDRLAALKAKMEKK